MIDIACYSFCELVLFRLSVPTTTMTKIVDKMTTELDLRAYHDGYKERSEALIASKMKGEVAQVKEKVA